MRRLVLEKTDEYNYVAHQDITTARQLERIFQMSFRNLNALKRDLAGIPYCSVPTRVVVENVDRLPFPVKELKIMYENVSVGLNLDIAKIKVI